MMAMGVFVPLSLPASYACWKLGAQWSVRPVGSGTDGAVGLMPELEGICIRAASFKPNTETTIPWSDEGTRAGDVLAYTFRPFWW